MDPESFRSNIDLSGLGASVDQIRSAIGELVIGQSEMVDLIIASMLANGHVLIEGVPGVAKTLTAKLIARCIDAEFSRIQFTPDIMPSDVLGTSVFDPKTSTFSFRKGPVFGNVILVDEINRAPAKTQSALFEVMEEKQITADGNTYHMDEPFFVLATQNPIEHEGTYRLPEAQLDRFLVKIQIDYPNFEEEVRILERHHRESSRLILEDIRPLISKEQIQVYRDQVRKIHIEKNILEFIARIIHETRNSRSLFLGASPRASLAIANLSKALAAMAGRDFITPDDVVKAAPAVLRHRIMLNPEKEIEGISADQIVSQIIEKIEVPR